MSYEMGGIVLTWNDLEYFHREGCSSKCRAFTGEWGSPVEKGERRNADPILYASDRQSMVFGPS